MPTRLFGYPTLRDIMRDIQNTHGDILVPLIFVLFFLFAAIAVYQQGRTRKLFVTFTLIGILITSQVAITFVPFINAHRYSTIDTQEDNQLYIVLIDNAGNEIRLDKRAISPYSIGSPESSLVHKWDDDRRLKISEELLLDADAYVDRVNSPLPRIKHPPSSAGKIWTTETVNDLGRFEVVQVHKIYWKYKTDSHQISQMNETCVLEIQPDTETVNDNCTNV